jgi:uncharacterized protein (TIGR03905 family)
MIKTYIYIPHGICPTSITIKINNDVIVSYQPNRGCSGNSQGVNQLLKGLTIDDAIAKLSGIKCGTKISSCPDQIAQALIQIKHHQLLPIE